MICADRNFQQIHPIIGGINIDHEKQVVITNIKSGMLCSMCYILPKKCKNLCKIWPR